MTRRKSHGSHILVRHDDDADDALDNRENPNSHSWPCPWQSWQDAPVERASSKRMRLTRQTDVASLAVDCHLFRDIRWLTAIYELSTTSLVGPYHVLNSP